MKIIIAGGRDYIFRPEDFRRLDGIKQRVSMFHGDEITEVVSGGARGADYGGEKWAEKNGILKTRFLADWHRLGKSAGPTRNQSMVDYSDAIAVFPGGRGTADVLARAQKAGLQIFDMRGE